MNIRNLALWLLVAGLVAWIPASAQATCSGGSCPITGGSLRLQIGGAVPIPIPALFVNPDGPEGLINTTNTAQGAIYPVSGAQITVGTGAHPRSIRLQPGQLTYGATGTAPPVEKLGIFLFEEAIFSVRTQLAAVFPETGAAATFAAGGRSGPPTVVMCPGAPPPNITYMPCQGPDTTMSGGPSDFSGIMTYTKTVAQFGGIARTGIPLPRNLSINFNALGETAVPCTGCVFGNQKVPPGSYWVMGAGWQASHLLAPVSNTPGYFIGTVNSSGLITNTVGPTASSNPFAGQTTTSIGGPWTTGMISVTVPGNLPPLTFVFTGSDQRNPANGEGTISLVSAGLANRSLSMAAPGRGWLTLTLPEPSGAVGLASGIALLMALSRRRRGRAAVH